MSDTEFSWVGGGSFRCMICFHHTFHPLMMGAGSPSISVLVLYLSFTPSLSNDPSSWGRMVLFILLRRLQFTEFLTSFQSISGRFWSIMEENVLEHSCSFMNSAFALHHIEKSQKPVIGFTLVLVCAELNSPWLIIITFQISYLENGNLVNKMKSQPLCC